MSGKEGHGRAKAERILGGEDVVETKIRHITDANEARNKMSARHRNPITGLGLGNDGGVFVRHRPIRHRISQTSLGVAPIDQETHADKKEINLHKPNPAKAIAWDIESGGGSTDIMNPAYVAVDDIKIRHGAKANAARNNIKSYKRNKKYQFRPTPANADVPKDDGDDSEIRVIFKSKERKMNTKDLSKPTDAKGAASEEKDCCRPIALKGVDDNVDAKICRMTDANEVRNKMIARERNPITGLGLGDDGGVFTHHKGLMSIRDYNPVTGTGYSLDRFNYSIRVEQPTKKTGDKPHDQC